MKIEWGMPLLGMSEHQWGTFKPELIEEMKQVRNGIKERAVLFEILALATPYVYKDFKVKKSPKVCREFWKKNDITDDFFNSGREILQTQETRMMLNSYGIEGTGKSIYLGLTVNRWLDATFDISRIANTNREVIEGIARAKKEGTDTAKMIMRDEKIREHGPDSMVSADLVQNMFQLLREEKMGYNEIGPRPSYDLNFHYGIRALDNTWCFKKLPPEGFKDLDERIDWMLSEPQITRALVSNIASKEGRGWHWPYPRGFVALTMPGIARSNGSYKKDKEGRELLKRYLEFKKEHNLKMATGEYSDDYTELNEALLEMVMKNGETVEKYARLFFKMERPDKEDGTRKIVGIKTTFASTLMRAVIKNSSDKWRMVSRSKLSDIMDDFVVYCVDHNIIGSCLEDFIVDADVLKKRAEDYDDFLDGVDMENLETFDMFYEKKGGR